MLVGPLLVDSGLPSPAVGAWPHTFASSFGLGLDAGCVDGDFCPPSSKSVDPLVLASTVASTPVTLGGLSLVDVGTNALLGSGLTSLSRAAKSSMVDANVWASSIDPKGSLGVVGALSTEGVATGEKAPRVVFEESTFVLRTLC